MRQQVGLDSASVYSEFAPGSSRDSRAFQEGAAGRQHVGLDSVVPGTQQIKLEGPMAGAFQGAASRQQVGLDYAAEQMKLEVPDASGALQEAAAGGQQTAGHVAADAQQIKVEQEDPAEGDFQAAQLLTAGGQQATSTDVAGETQYIKAEPRSPD
jgi:hypothetical protein